MRQLRYFLGAALFAAPLFLGGSALCADIVPLEEVLQRVVENHPQILARQQDFYFAQASYMGAMGRFDTVLVANQDFTRTDTLQNTPTTTQALSVRLAIPFKSGITVIPAFSQRLNTTDAASASLDVNIPLLRNNKIAQTHYLGQAEDNLEAARNEYMQQLAISLKDTIDLYLEWVRIDQHLQIATVILDWTQTQEKRLKDLVIARTKPVSDYDAVQAESALKKATIAQLTQQKKDIENQIQFVMGLPLGGDNLQPEYTSPTANSLEESFPAKKDVLERRFDVIALTYQKQALAHQLRLQQMNLWPRLDLNMGVGSYRYDNQASQLFSSNSQNEYSYRVGVQTELPLQNRVLRGSKDQAKAQETLVAIQLEQLTRRIEMDVDLANREVKQTLATLRLKRQTRELLTKSRDNEEKRFHAGVSTLTELLSRQFRLEDAQYEELSAVIDYYKALNNWSYQTGTIIQKTNTKTTMAKEPK